MSSEPRQPIRIDPVTGLKVFDTRAESKPISGGGYRVVTDASLKVLPDPPPGAVFNA